MENHLCSIADQIANDTYTLQTLLMHASVKKRTKAEIQDDLDKMNEIVLRIRKLVCGR